MNNISRGLLQQGMELKILTLNTFKHPLSIEALPDDYVKKTKIETVFIDTRVKMPDAGLNLFSRGSYNVKRFYSELFAKKIGETLQKDNYDIVHLESLFVTPYLDIIREKSDAVIIYRAHNLEYEIWEELTESEKNFFKKRYLAFLSGRIKNYELGLLNQFDGIAAISEEDSEKFRQLGSKVPVEAIPLGIDISEYATPVSLPLEQGENIFFLGSMDWLPNREGVEWFLEKVWKIVRAKHPGLKLRIAGKGMPRKYFGPGIPGVEVIGEVADAKKFMRSNGVMIVPLLSGSGVRVKIIEAMALRKVVIATSLAAAGLHVSHKKNILVSDSPEGFAELISLAVTHPELRKDISEDAGKFAEKNFDNRTIAKKLVSFYNHIIERQASHQTFPQ